MPHLNIESLKRAAKAHKKARGCSHAEALDFIAAQHGYKNWSRLAKAAAGQVDAPVPAPPTRGRASAEVMADWFRANHTPAIEESPWDSAEGGYLWPLVDEDFGVNDILREQFPDASDDAIDEAIAALDDEGPWIHPDFAARMEGDA